MSPRAAVVLATFNARERVEELLAALRAFTVLPTRLVLVDDGSTDGTREIVERFAEEGDEILDAVVLRTAVNAGYSAAFNEALARVGDVDYVVGLCASHSLVVRDGWDRELVEFMDARPRVALAGDLWHPRVPIESELYREGWSPLNHDGECLHVQGGAWIARRRVFDEHGGLNARQYPHDFADVELSFRLLSCGEELAACPAISAGPPSSELDVRPGVSVYHHPPESERARVRAECGLPPLLPREERLLCYDGGGLPWTREKIREVAGPTASLDDHVRGELVIRVADGASVRDVEARLARVGLKPVREGDVSVETVRRRGTMEKTTEKKQEKPGLKLDLACGRNCRDGFEGVDIARADDRVKHVVNLLAFPWPFESGSVAEVNCSQFVEHLPMLFWTPIKKDVLISYKDPEAWDWTRRLTPYPVDGTSVDLLMKFFSEVWRILEPGGKALVVTPQAHSDRAFQDPTHRRFLVPTSFLYLDAEWRKREGLEHAAYGVECDFPIGKSFLRHFYPDENLVRLNSEAANLARTKHEWNFAGDLVATLEKSTRFSAAPTEKPSREAVSAT